MLASPYGSLKRGKLMALAAEIKAIATKEGAGGLVVGLRLAWMGPLARRPRQRGIGQNPCQMLRVFLQRSGMKGFPRPRSTA